MDYHKRNTSSDSDAMLTSRCSSPKDSNKSLSQVSTIESVGCIVDMTKYKKNLTMALPSKEDSVCWISSFPQGDYQLDWDDTSAVQEKITKDELEEYCQNISVHCTVIFNRVLYNQIKQSKRRFHIGIVLLVLIIIIIGGFGFVFKFYWAPLIDLFILVFALFFLYNFMRGKLEKITEDLKKHIKEYNLEAKSIKTKIGKYGRFLSFRLILAPAVSANV